MVDISSLVRRADAYAKATGRSSGGVSKSIFEDTRTLDLLRGGHRDITVARLERADAALTELERKAMERSQ